MTCLTKNDVLYGFEVEERYSPIDRRPVRRLVQLFPGIGCRIWLNTQGESCVFCRLPAGTRLAVLGEGHEGHFQPWHVKLEDYIEMYEASMRQSDGVECITLFNGGSFIDDKEIPKAFREHVYRGFARHPTARRLMIEARPEFVTDAALDEAQDLIGDKELMIGIGLESIDDHVRNVVLKKFMGRPGFERAIERMHKRNVRSFVYVFLGAPGLDERSAYLDAARTIAHLADMGVDEIALSCAFVPPGGHLEELYERGEFRPPWLWSTIKLLDEAQAHGYPLTVGGFDDFPPPVAISHNCGQCDNGAMAVIDRYRSLGVLEGHLQLTCGCQREWRHSMGNAAPA